MCMKTIDQIIEDLNKIASDIPMFLQSGRPENIKAENHRSLETRMNQAIIDLALATSNISETKNIIKGTFNPNTNPPADYEIGSFYLRQDALENNLALYIYTGVHEDGWFLLRDLKRGNVTETVSGNFSIDMLQVSSQYNITLEDDTDIEFLNLSLLENTDCLEFRMKIINRGKYAYSLPSWLDIHSKSDVAGEIDRILVVIENFGAMPSGFYKRVTF